VDALHFRRVLALVAGGYADKFGKGEPLQFPIAIGNVARLV
jgi:hypothetical protein